jgi:hypothetical protein
VGLGEGGKVIFTPSCLFCINRPLLKYTGAVKSFSAYQLRMTLPPVLHVVVQGEIHRVDPKFAS